MTARERVAGNVAGYVDDRTGAAKYLKKSLSKVFPDHWSFLLGEICLYSFIILLASGTFLTFWFDPSMKEVVYDGEYAPLQGVNLRNSDSRQAGEGFLLFSPSGSPGALK